MACESFYYFSPFSVFFSSANELLNLKQQRKKLSKKIKEQKQRIRNLPAQHAIIFELWSGTKKSSKKLKIAWMQLLGINLKLLTKELVVMDNFFYQNRVLTWTYMGWA
jgi:pantothenate kinase